MLSDKERLMVLEYISSGADIMFMPSSELGEMLSRGCPQAQGISSGILLSIISRSPIRLDAKMVIKYCKGGLDEKNKWLLDHGDLKIVPQRYMSL